MRKSKIVAATSASILVAVLTACGSSDAVGESAESARPTDSAASTAVTELTVSIGADEGTLTPYTYVTGFPGWNLMNLVYDTLLELDEKNQPRPLLASDYEVSDDGMTYTLTIAEGVQWQDGEPFTAEDVAFTLDYYAANSQSRFTPQVAAIEDVAVDGTTVTIGLTAPNPSFLVRPLADMPMLPAHVWTGITDPKTATVEQAIGTGPYRLVEHTTDQSYAFEKNDEYAFGEPTVQDLRVAIIPEEQTALAALRSGEIDAVGTGAAPNLADQVAGQDGIEVADGPEFGSTMLLFNNEVAPFDDPSVRSALAQAIDVQEIVDTVRLGRATVGSSGYVHPAMSFAADLPPYEVDTAAAAAALDQAGLTEGADGARMVDGAPLTIELLVYADSPDRIRAAELIAEMLDQVGVTVEVTPQDADAVDAQVWPDFDVASGRDFQMAIWGWSAPTMLDPVRIASLVNSDTVIGSLNVQGSRDADLDRASQAVVDAATIDLRDTAVEELQTVIAATAPFVTLYYEDGLYPYSAEAYDGWVFQQGQGILQKLSLVDASAA